MTATRTAPTWKRLAAALLRVFRRQAAEAYAQLRRGQPVRLHRWDAAVAELAEPLLRHNADAGLRRFAAALRRAVRDGRAGPLASRRFGLGFDYLRPEVLDAVRQQAFTFARVTTETAERNAVGAVETLREELTQGLTAGDPLTLLAARVGKAVASPDRALTVAATESSRALHAGEYAAARAAGAWGLEWLAAADCCDLCASLDGTQVPLGHAFHVRRTGRPEYAMILHAPAHPRCACSHTWVWVDPRAV